MRYFLKEVPVDNGYPDPGHDEWVLCRIDKRRSSFLQKILGDKTTKILWYGEEKPTDNELQLDIDRYTQRDTEYLNLL